jgi:hypothetical protein
MLNDVGSSTSSLGRRTFYVGSMFTWTNLTSEKLYVGCALLSVCMRAWGGVIFVLCVVHQVQGRPSGNIRGSWLIIMPLRLFLL